MHLNQQLATPLEHFCGNYLVTIKSFDPEITSCTTTRYLLGQHLKIHGSLCMYTFSNICRNFTALGIRNAPRDIEYSILKSKFGDFFICLPAKYTVLRVQHTGTQKKYFFGTRMSNLSSK